MYCINPGTTSAALFLLLTFFLPTDVFGRRGRGSLRDMSLNPDFARYRCQGNDPTRYDREVVHSLKGRTKVAVPVDSSTIVFVVDMQNDFVHGSFAQPCWEKRVEVTGHIQEIIQKSHAAGATIIASLDFHEEKHCSFEGREACKNEVFFTSDTQRYNNSFPPHTIYTIQGERTAFKRFGVAYDGAALHSPIRSALWHASRNDSARVFEVFKGFSNDRESFSAFPHTYIYPRWAVADWLEPILHGFRWLFPAKARELPTSALEPFTGGFLVNKTMNGTDTACFSTAKPADGCLPTKAQVNDPLGEMYGVDKLVDALKTTNDITQILVTGLFFDLGVKETAMAIKKWDPDLAVNVVVEATRPSFEDSLLEGDHLTACKDLVDAEVALVSHSWLKYEH